MKSKKKRLRRGKHVPQRTCVGCRTVQAKRSLTRIVRTPAGVFIDPKGNMAGRGAYLHDLRACWDQGLKTSLARALKTELTEEDRQRLAEHLAGLTGSPPEDSQVSSGALIEK